MSLIEVYPNLEGLSHAAGEKLVAIAQGTIAAHSRFSLCLSGGSTPRALYQHLARPEISSKVPWEAVHVFWGDERVVPPDNQESNYRMAYKTFLSKAPIPPQNIHRIRAELDPCLAASLYEDVLRRYFHGGGDERGPSFDLILLGMGVDGHTASLFPHTVALSETFRWVVAHYVPTLEAWRITLTPHAINQASRVWFIVTGLDKAEPLARVLEGPPKPEDLPAQMIQPVSGDLTWLLDVEATSGLTGSRLI